MAHPGIVAPGRLGTRGHPGGRTLGSDAAQIAAMKTDQIDGLVLDVATALRLESTGEGRIVLYFGDIIKDFIQNAAYARRELVATDPDRVRRFLAGWYQTIAYMSAHKEESIRISMPIVGLPEDLAARGYEQWMEAYSGDGRFDPGALALLAKSFVDMGLLPAEPDMKRLYTEEFFRRGSSGNCPRPLPVSLPGIARGDGRKRPNVPAISMRDARKCPPERDGRDEARP